VSLPAFSAWLRFVWHGLLRSLFFWAASTSIGVHCVYFCSQQNGQPAEKEIEIKNTEQKLANVYILQKKQESFQALFKTQKQMPISVSPLIRP